MSATVVIEGLVQERSGKRLNVSVAQRRRTQAGEWETAGYSRFTVWLRDESDHAEVVKGTVVLVQGNLQVQQVEKDGRTFVNAVVSARSVGVVRQTGGTGSQRSQAPAYDASVPF